MRVLHYSLGLPPYRTGGLTKYSLDLMKEQVKNEDKVYLLFPGKIRVLSNGVKISKYKNYLGIEVFELINPLPVPLLNGIRSFEDFKRDIDTDIFKSFLEKNLIEVVHIHTFMGLPKEFLEVCNQLSIKVLFTTHDYYGICPKVNLLDYNGKICKERNLEKCVICNKTAYTRKMMFILQSQFYRELKNYGLVDRIKNRVKCIKKYKDNQFCSEINMQSISVEEVNEFNKILKYYKEMFSNVDQFLFNSSLTKEIYEKYITCKGNVVTITHEDIKDNRRIKNYNHKTLSITYLGPNKSYKGYDILIDAVKELLWEGYDILLNLYGGSKEISNDKNIIFNGRYNYSEMNEIFKKTDLLVVPSKWYETFGFTTLEAISYGVPVLLTSLVGSKELIESNSNCIGKVVEPTKYDLFVYLKKLCESKGDLIKFNRNIVSCKFIWDINSHYKTINKYYLE